MTTVFNKKRGIIKMLSFLKLNSSSQLSQPEFNPGNSSLEFKLKTALFSLIIPYLPRSRYLHRRVGTSPWGGPPPRLLFLG